MSDERLGETAPTASREAMLRAAAPPVGAFIAGAFRTIAETMPAASPLRLRWTPWLARCTAREIEQAVAAARTTFEVGAWSRAAPRERKRVLLAAADGMERQAERFALLETLETGRPLREARRVDVAGAIGRLRWYAELADKPAGVVAPAPPGRLGIVAAVPVGVVAAVVPWNFPLLMAVTKVAPALLAGNSVILKPAEQSSLTALLMAECFAAAGLPDGALQVVTGLGAECGAPLVAHPGVDAVAFTGSTRTGLAILAAAAPRMARVSLECGGKSPHLVLDPAAATEAMIDQVAWGVAYNQGQVCDAGANVILVGPGHEDFAARVAARLAAFTAGDPFDESLDLGSMIGDAHLERVDGFVRRAIASGLRPLNGGGRQAVNHAGAYYAPTVFDAVPTESEIFREEVFGPVLAIASMPDAESAIRLVNGAEYGLAAAVWGSDAARAMAVADRLRVGTVAVNCFELGDIATPFGGFRRSGLGRDRSVHALANYTELRTTWARVAA